MSKKMASEVPSSLSHSVKDILGSGQSHLNPWEKMVKEPTVRAVARHKVCSKVLGSTQCGFTKGKLTMLVALCKEMRLGWWSNREWWLKCCAEKVVIHCTKCIWRPVTGGVV